MKNFFSFVLTLISFINGYAQTSIKMKREGGVSIVPCKINGLPLSFIFDTGAPDVSISLTEARFMFKNGYLTSSDILGTSKFSDATGTISEGLVINLKEIEFAGLKLYNIRASIVNSLNAPLLLGQSAIKKLGKFEVNFETNMLTINNVEKGQYDYSDYSYFQIDMSEEPIPSNNVQPNQKLKSLKEIGSLMDKQKYYEAKDGIDFILALDINKNDPEAYYYKGRIYNSLSRSISTTKINAYKYKLVAYNAFLKNQAIDKLDLRMKSEFYKSYLDLYLGFYDLGAQFFNEKNYSYAYKAFTKSQGVENFILSKSYEYPELKLNRLDTALTMNIAASALQASDTSNAIINYRRITDAGISGAEYERVYEFLSRYYFEKGDNNQAQTIQAKARSLYPNNKFWDRIEVEQISKSGNTKALFDRYEELYNQDPHNFANTYNYAVEMFNKLWASHNNNPELNLYPILITVLKSAIEVDETMDATMLLSNHLFNVAADYSTKVANISDSKTTNPYDLKRKNEYKSLSLNYMNQLIPYAQKMLKFFEGKPTLNNKQKINYKQVAGYLSDAYRVKGDPKKSAEYDTIIDNIKF